MSLAGCVVRGVLGGGFYPSCHGGVCLYESVLGEGVEGWPVVFIAKLCSAFTGTCRWKRDVLWSYLFILHLACLLQMHLRGCRPPRHRERMQLRGEHGPEANPSTPQLL